MIERDHHVEVLAQAIWRGLFGERRILPEWTKWATENSNEAISLRSQASDMLSVHEGMQPSGNKTTNHSSLGWLY